MKKTMLFIAGLILSMVSLAQTQKIVTIPIKGNIHIVSPEPIQYVDISTKDIIGDLPLKNILRLKLKDSSAVPHDAIVTIVGQKFITQYQLVPGQGAFSQVDIMPADMNPLDISGIGFSETELRTLALRLFAKKPDKNIGATTAFGLKGKVNHIYTAGDFIFLDLSYRNKTELRYTVDALRFKIEDKKVTKATNDQSIEIKPEFTLFNVPQFDKGYRNIFVFRKISFPGNKRLVVELSERPISGRVLTINIAYQDVLDADVISF